MSNSQGFVRFMCFTPSFRYHEYLACETPEELQGLKNETLTLERTQRFNLANANDCLAAMRNLIAVLRYYEFNDGGRPASGGPPPEPSMSGALPGKRKYSSRTLTSLIGGKSGARRATASEGQGRRTASESGLGRALPGPSLPESNPEAAVQEARQDKRRQEKSASSEGSVRRMAKKMRNSIRKLRRTDPGELGDEEDNVPRAPPGQTQASAALPGPSVVSTAPLGPSTPSLVISGPTPGPVSASATDQGPTPATATSHPESSRLSIIDPRFFAEPE